MGLSKGTVTMTVETANNEVRRKPGRSSRRARVWILVVAAAAALAIAAIAWAYTSGFFAAKTPAAEFHINVGQPTFVSESDLKAYGDSHAPVYWAGPMDDVNYEITQASTGSTFIRYVPKSEPVGTSKEALTVATYPEQQGYRRLQEAATEQNMGSQTTKSGALIVVNPNAPLSTYFSFPDASFQVEVFSPTPDESKQKVLDGGIRLLGN